MAARSGQSWMEFLVTVNDVKSLLAAQPTYIITQSVFILAGLITLIHAFKKGGRWPYFWLGTVLHGIYADNFWHFVLPEYDNFWHSQTPIMFLGGRLPLHIILLYPAFIYHAGYAVSRLNLPKYAQPFAVGLLTVLIDIPYDIVSVKFVHWTWHDTDPNIFDRHYWVPWNSYYFHAAFASCFYFVFTATRDWMAPKITTWSAASIMIELKSLIIATLLGMPAGVLMFVPIYHPMHDVLKIHSEVTFFLLFSIFFSIIFLGLISDRDKSKNSRLTTIDYVMIIQLFIHYAVYLVLVVFFDPEKERSLGLHEPVGPCNEKSSLVTPFGQKLLKRKYLCPSDYDEKYFNFCGGKPKDGATSYLICGTPFENRAEYIIIMATILCVASTIFYGIYFKTTAVQTSPPTKKQKTK